MHSDSWIGKASNLPRWQIDDSLDRAFGVKPKGRPDNYRIAPHTINTNQAKWKRLCAQHFGKSYTVKSSKINDDEYTLSGENF